MRRPFFYRGKMEKNGGKKTHAKKKSTHILSTPTQLGNHIALVLFVVVMALARETTRAAESDEMKTMKKKNKTPPSQHNSPTVHHPFSFHCSATCSHGMLRCDVCLFFFLSRFSLSLSFSRIFYSRRRRRTFERRE